MDAELMTLVSTAATAVVQTLATDGWEQAKRAIGALWGRVHPERAETVEAELAEAHSGMMAAGDDQMERDLIAEWQGRFRRLLATEPGLAEELRRIADELTRALPDAERSTISRIEMHATASGHARVNQAGRDQQISDA